AVQRPRVVLVDADTEGAFEVVERMRELPDTDDIHVLFIARPGGAIATPEEALAHEGSGLFLRPVEVAALVQRVHTLTVGARMEGIPAPVRAPPTPPPSQKGPSAPPSLPPVSMRASIPPSAPESQSSVPPSPRPSKSPSDPPAALGGGAPRRFMSLAPPVSPELQELLAEAEQRVHVQVERESVVPSPEDEIEAVLPADMLAALDEPLDEDDDDDDPVVPPRSTSSLAARERTSVRSGSRAPRTATSPGSSTSGPPPRTGPGIRPSETPAAPAAAPTHGGTHAGPTGDGISTTGGLESRERSDAAVRASIASVASPQRGRHAGESAPPPSSGWGQAAATASPPRDSFTPSGAPDVPFPAILGAGAAMRVVARAIAGRTTGSLCIAAHDDVAAATSPPRGQRVTERRIVLREGDVVTTSSTAEDESLLAFLGVRGDLPRETVRRLGSKFPPFGRHAGAALVARGYIRQDQMWPTLRAHAEWLFARVLQTANGRLAVDPHPSGRLGGEPGVFGGSTGAAVFVEVVRRIVPPAEAVERLGGIGSQVGEGPEIRLLSECGLDPAEMAEVQAAPGRPIRDVVDAAPEGDLATVIFALSQLGVLEVMRVASDAGGNGDDPSAPDVAALDTEAVRERVRARMQLVEDGDYFALLGVPRDATGYEVRRAFLELRRAFDPSRVITPEVSDLFDDVRKITAVLEEAYEI
ncbi:MAG TPA: hypothetical protein VN894_11265, partial [Polyangiaceae bacterium]|nr:hypothetical protein [Polyangiaceae bacterium]